MPLPFVETWTGTNGDNWNAGRWENIRRDDDYGGATTSAAAFIQGNRGQVTASGSGVYPSHMATPITGTVADVDITISWAWTTAGGSDEQGNGVIYRCNTNLVVPDPYPNECYVFGNYTHSTGGGSNVSFGYYGTGLAYTELWADTSVNHQNTNRRWVHMIAEGTRHRGRWWVDGSPEPTTWTWDLTDSTYTAAGHILLTFYAGDPGLAVESTWDDLTIGTAAVTPPFRPRRRNQLTFR